MIYGLENINIVIPEGETEETTTHDTLGADRISFDEVLIGGTLTSSPITNL